jgi:serine/threonine protein kinase
VVLGGARFEAEIRICATLQHPHTPPLFDSGSADGLLFYVMPLVEGESLRALLTREKQLSIADAVGIATVESRVARLEAALKSNAAAEVSWWMLRQSGGGARCLTPRR